MTKSESIAQLAEALSKAQAEMECAKKDADNPFFKSKYADLSSVWAACRGPLTKNGLSVVQMPSAEGNHIIVHTLLMHSSGEWIASELAMTPTKSDPQGAGSAITYARRYALSAAVGIAPDDDDGNAASQKPVERTTKPEPIQRPTSPPVLSREPGEDDEDLTSTLEAAIAQHFIDQGQQVNLAKSFRDALPPTRKKESEFLRSQWLESEKYIDAAGNPSSKVIPVSAWPLVREKAVLFAKGQPA